MLIVSCTPPAIELNVLVGLHGTPGAMGAQIFMSQPRCHSHSVCNLMQTRGGFARKRRGEACASTLGAEQSKGHGNGTARCLYGLSGLPAWSAANGRGQQGAGRPKHQTLQRTTMEAFSLAAAPCRLHADCIQVIEENTQANQALRVTAHSGCAGVPDHGLRQHTCSCHAGCA